jgi:hypothetical protein
MRNWLSRRLAEPLLTLLRQGVSPQRLTPICIYLLYRLLTPVFERMAAQIRRLPVPTRKTS